MAEIRKIEAGLARYIDTELIPKLPDDGVKRFGVGLVSGLIAKRGGLMLEQLAKNPTLQMLTIADSAGGIDVGLLYEVAKEKVPTKGISVVIPVVGKLTIYPDDIDTLYRYICGEGKSY